MSERSGHEGRRIVASAVLLLLATSAALAQTNHVSLGARGRPQPRQPAVFAGPGDQKNPAVAFNELDSNFMVIWENDEASEIEGRIVTLPTTAGGPLGLGPVFTISSSGPLKPINDPTLAYNSTRNTYLVAWQEATADEDLLRGALLGPAGETLPGSPFRIDAVGCEADDPSIAYTTGHASMDDGVEDEDADDESTDGLASSETDRWLVVWNQDDSSPCDEDLSSINGRLVNGDGTFVGPVFDVSTNVEGHTDESNVAYDSTGQEFLVAFERESPEASNTDILGQRVSPAGDLLGLELQLAANLLKSTLRDPGLAYSPEAAGYFVVWRNVHDEDPIRVEGRFVSGGTAVLGPRYFISDGTGTAANPAVTFHSADR